MLKITTEPLEFWNDELEEFITDTSNQVTIYLEHSLVSISKWESIYNRPFLLKTDKKSYDETIEYIKCMTITQNIKDEVYTNLSPNNIEKINEYIGKSMTATTFNDFNKSTNREIITSELIYYWMIALNIPMECQKWHINRLLTLVRICNIKNSPNKKMGRRELSSKYASMNAARKQQLGTRG